MKTAPAQITHEFAPPEGVESVAGVCHDGQSLWIATGDTLKALDPMTGSVRRSLDVPAQAGTAFDGRHLFQIAEDVIQKVDPESGAVLAVVPAPEGGASGLAWAEGMLWVGQYRNRRIHQVEPDSGRIVRTIECDRFVTGVTWVGGELWHGSWEGEESSLRRVDPNMGDALEELLMPDGTGVSGLGSDGAGRFFCGGGGSGKVRVVRRPAPAGAVG